MNHEKCEGLGIIYSENGDKEFCSCVKGKNLEVRALIMGLAKEMTV